MSTKSGVYPCYENQFQVKAGGNYKAIADCESFSVSFDNGVEEWTPFDSEGWTRRLQTAKSIIISVTAKRNVGDDGNDYIAGLAFVNGRATEADFKWSFPDGSSVEMVGAVVNVTAVSAGDSTAVAPLEFDVMSNGKPTVTPAQ